MGRLRHRNDGATPGGARILPVEPPTGTTSLARARQREARFLERFCHSARELGPIPHPNRSGTLRRWTAPVREERLVALRDLLESLRLHDRNLLERLPACGAARVHSRARGWWRRRPELTITAVTWSPWGELARSGRASSKAGLEELESLVRSARRSAAGHHVVGALSTTGWDAAVSEGPLVDGSTAVVLVDPLPSGGWKLHHQLPREYRELCRLFEPEDRSERDQRCLELLLADEELSIPGGHRDVEDLVAAYGVDSSVLARAVERAAACEVPLEWVRLDGRELVKRSRFVCASPRVGRMGSAC